MYVAFRTYNYINIIVSATRRRRDIKKLFVGHHLEKFNVVTMDASKTAIFAFQSVKPVLQPITHLIQYTVLEIQFWAVKCTTVTARSYFREKLTLEKCPSFNFKCPFDIHVCPTEI